ncbi:DNA cytosine methyltransferase [Rosenbergiella nectarea]|uniref:DNA cytosine methyltransferase n=1 Tax=Rosenbergiella nectarea TaxID=988801 RepID=UPI001F4EE9CE|nr:DNA cytosine methyltransferase [Rosenbergiella nectarea]
MTAYYNEFDPKAAAWLRELIKQGHIADGVVDDRSITDVKPEDLAGFTQCHFFAGIGGWSYALRLAGIPDDYPCWTGSPPCQPFSVAGKQLGQLDERHLAPTFMRLVDECKPAILFGEQVAAAIGKHWLDDLFTELERQGYACGSAVFPACSVGAPHKRDRLFFGSKLVVHANNEYQHTASNKEGITDLNRSSLPLDNLANTNGGDPSTKGIQRFMQYRQPAQDCSTLRCEPKRVRNRYFKENSTDSHNNFWSNSDWLGCRDGKFRAVESGTFPLANGIPARMGRLRGYGNAIVPQVAAEFIGAFMESIK